MTVVGKIKKGAYFDSVALMTVGREISAFDGVVDAAVVMGTRENKAILSGSGLLTPDFEEAGDCDLLIAVKLENAESVEGVLSSVEEHLKQARNPGGNAEEFSPMSLEGALDISPDANLALISVAGKYAGDEAMKALEAGLHVMLFSDNVAIEKEAALKRFARDKGLLVMGPDCGTAIINGVPLAFANVVKRGAIGVVAASGTGLQEVTSIISNEGCGISQAIGTGGRDVKKDVGGIMFIEAMKSLASDESTEVILLVSKPPHEDVLREIIAQAETIDKPVVSFFLGADSGSLEKAALLAVAYAKGEDPAEVGKQLAARKEEIVATAREEAGGREPGQKYVRGLFSGGTFCSEAQILFDGMISQVYSNAPTGTASRLEDSLKSVKNTVVDLGEDEFTVGRPHPMIDFALRTKRIRDEADDPETAVILLDVVLGYGSNMDPAGELRDVVRDASRKVSVVCSITGTDDDPQDRKHVETVLSSAGAVVMPSNAAACELAGQIVRNIEQCGARSKEVSGK